MKFSVFVFFVLYFKAGNKLVVIRNFHINTTIDVHGFVFSSHAWFLWTHHTVLVRQPLLLSFNYWSCEYMRLTSEYDKHHIENCFQWILHAMYITPNNKTLLLVLSMQKSHCHSQYKPRLGVLSTTLDIIQSFKSNQIKSILSVFNW